MYGKGNGRLCNIKTDRDYSDYCIIKIGQNTKKLEETCCSDSSGKPPANAGVKNSQMTKIIIIIIIMPSL